MKYEIEEKIDPLTIGKTVRFCSCQIGKKKYCGARTYLVAKYTDEHGHLRERPVCEKHRHIYADQRNHRIERIGG